MNEKTETEGVSRFSSNLSHHKDGPLSLEEFRSNINCWKAMFSRTKGESWIVSPGDGLSILVDPDKASDEEMQCKIMIESGEMIDAFMPCEDLGL